MNRGIYVHVPFCVRKCAYCDFYSRGGADGESISAYADTLIKHMEMSHDKGLFCDSLYFGGGTPSLMNADDVGKIIEAAGKNFDLAQNAEITSEVNPGTVDREKFRNLKSVGVNRISLGVQSLDDGELGILGRLHDADTAKKAIESAFAAGFDNVSCDVMFGLPRQTAKSLTATLDGLCAYPITHISVYGLKIEPGTPFSRQKLDLPDEDAEKAMYFAIIENLKSHGFKQYEISNFARGGKTSRHNLKYWRGEEYLAFGPAAAGYLHGERYAYARDLDGYTAAINKGENPPEAERYTVDDAEKAREKVIFGLRLAEGINLAECGISAAALHENPVTARLLKENYMTLDASHLSLTPTGFYISNAIISELLNQQS